MKRKIWKRGLAAALAGLMQLVCLQGYLPLRAEESGNLLQDHLESAKGIMQFVSNGAVQDDTRFSKAAIDNVTDGNTEAHADVGGALDWEQPRYVGAQFTLDAVYDVNAVWLYAGYSNLKETYQVYASESLESLYTPASLIAKDVECDGSRQGLDLDETVRAKFIAVVCTAYDGNMRVAEFQVSGTAAKADTSVNLLQDHLESAKGIMQFVSNGAVQDDTRFSKAAIDNVTDGNTETRADVGGALDWEQPRYVGAQFTLDAVYDVNAVWLYAGYPNLKETYQVYASESLDSLYAPESLIAKDVECDGSRQGLDLDKTVRAKYIAVVCTAYDGNMRVAEFQVMGTAAEPDTSVNLLQKHMAGAKGILQDAQSGDVTEHDRFSGEALAAMTDGDTAGHKDVYGALDWTPSKYVGAQFELDDTYDINAIWLYAGYPNLKETYRIYAAESLDALYTAAGLVAEAVECDGTKVGVKLGETKPVRYIAIVCTAYDGNMRVAELQVMGTAGEKETMNLLPGFSEGKGVVQDVATGEVADHTRFSADALAAVVDGDLEKPVDVYGALDWDPAKYVGAQFALDDVYEVNAFWVYAGYPNLKDTYKVYAAEKLEDLYQAKSLVAENLACDGTQVGIQLDEYRKIQYVAFICTAYEGNMRVREFQVMGKVPEEKPKNIVNLLPVTPVDAKFVMAKGDSPDAIDFAGYEPLSLSAAELDKLCDGNRAGNHADLHADRDQAASYLGVLYDMRAAYKLTGARLFAYTGDLSVPNLIVYAGTDLNTLVQDANRLYEKTDDAYAETGEAGANIGSSGFSLEDSVEARYVLLFFNSNTATEDDWCRVTELEVYIDATGIKLPEKPKDDDAYVETWPQPPAGDSILLGAKAESAAQKGDVTVYPIKAAGRQYAATQVFYYQSASQASGGFTYDVFSDGDTDAHYDLWSANSGDAVGMLYDLGAYYDLSHVRMFAGLKDSPDYSVNGYRVYASATKADLYRDQSLVYSYKNTADGRGEMGYTLVEPKRVRYIAFFITHPADGIMRLRECEAYGQLSEDQSEPEVPETPESLIQFMNPDIFGVTKDNLYKPGTVLGTSPSGSELTDGVFQTDEGRQTVEFWGGKENTDYKYVFTYDLGANYDLTGAMVYAVPDMLDNGVHKGIESWTFYASRYEEDLFKPENALIGKSGFEKEDEADSESEFQLKFDAAKYKQARYVSFVFTIKDTLYGGCRLTELEVYGTLSAEQDVEPEPEKLPEYVEWKLEDGVIVRVYQKEETDTLELGAAVTSSRSADEDTLWSITEQLDNRYYAQALYTLRMVDDLGEDINADGRMIRVYLPLPSGRGTNSYQVACVDDYGAELVLSSVIDGYAVVETQTLRNYAVVYANGAEAGGADTGVEEPVWCWILAAICTPAAFTAAALRRKKQTAD